MDGGGRSCIVERSSEQTPDSQWETGCNLWGSPTMNVRLSLVIGCLFPALVTSARAADRMQFWNLTGETISKLYLAPPGTSQWGPNQCANDPDGAVDSDERLKLKDVAPGRYDVKLTDATGRTCIVRDVTVQGGKAYAFSLSPEDLKECSK